MKVGVLGGGQLGRMLALAGIPMGFGFRFLDPDGAAPAGHVGELHVGSYEDRAALSNFATGLDVATFEFENVPAKSVLALGGYVLVYPGLVALDQLQDRLSEKTLIRSLGIPTAEFVPLNSAGDLRSLTGLVGLPAVVKTRRFGYDGKDQWVVRSEEECEAIARHLPASPDTLILEGFVDFEREVSLIAARGRRGEMAFYPLAENLHLGGILRRSIAPAPGATAALQQTAERYARQIAEELEYVGVLAVELFERAGELLVNEVAPRVHNSGHWTIEGAETSQFENHLRAISGLPLGSTAARGVSAMWNVLGSPPAAESILEIPGAHLHLYGKAPRAGRKIGHVTVVSTDGSDLAERIERIAAAAPQT